jgi:hypothetical protein
MHTFDVGDLTLAISREAIRLGQRELAADEIDGLQVVRTNILVNGALVSGERCIILRTPTDTLEIDFSRLVPDHQRLDRDFDRAFELIWNLIGARLLNQMVYRLTNGETIRIGGVTVDRDGVWLDGGWKFLGWKAEPRRVPWTDLKWWVNDGTLFLGSRSDLRLRSDISINDTENALIFDTALRFLLDKNNWKRLRAADNAD